MGPRVVCETDKAWDAIHRCLTDGSLRTEPTSPERHCVLGGRQPYAGQDDIAAYLTAQETAMVGAAIESVTRALFRDRCESIDARQYGVPLDDHDFGYTWSYFVQLRDFYRRASAGAILGRPADRDLGVTVSIRY